MCQYYRVDHTHPLPFSGGTLGKIRIPNLFVGLLPRPDAVFTACKRFERVSGSLVLSGEFGLAFEESDSSNRQLSFLALAGRTLPIGNSVFAWCPSTPTDAASGPGFGVSRDILATHGRCRTIARQTKTEWRIDFAGKLHRLRRVCLQNLLLRSFQGPPAVPRGQPGREPPAPPPPKFSKQFENFGGRPKRSKNLSRLIIS